MVLSGVNIYDKASLNINFINQGKVKSWEDSSHFQDYGDVAFAYEFFSNLIIILKTNFYYGVDINVSRRKKYF